MSEIVLTLPYPVSANRYWRSFVPRGKGRAITVLSDEARAYREEVAWRAKAAGIRAPLSGRMELEIRLFPTRPADWARRARANPESWDDDVRCIDLGNCEKVLSDGLNGVVWTDDRQLRRIVLVRCEPDGEGRTEVVIRPQVREPVQGQLLAA